MFRAFPTILIAVALYNLLAFGGLATGHADIAALLALGTDVPMFAGGPWHINVSDGFIALALVFLFVEVVKATRTSTREIVNHALSLLTFIGALLEFILLKGFATSAFFFVMAMCLFDVVAGYSISIVAAKRDVHVTRPGHEDEY